MAESETKRRVLPGQNIWGSETPTGERSLVLSERESFFDLGSSLGDPIHKSQIRREDGKKFWIDTSHLGNWTEAV